MRRAHILKPFNSGSIPSECIWFDTETKQEQVSLTSQVHHLWYGYAAYSRRLPDTGWTTPEWLRFQSKNQFYVWLEAHARNKCKTYVFCHNTNFDLPVMDVFHELPRRGWQLTGAVIEAPPTMLTFTKGAKKLYFLDTLNIWREPLSRIGSMIGLPKLDMPPTQTDSSAWDVYCRRDVEIIMKACIDWWQFIVDQDLGGFSTTLAGQALRTYRYRFMTRPIYIDNDETALNLSRRSYLGGRCEAYRLGRVVGKISCYDINSMYPYVMSANKYPTKLIGTTSHATVSELEEWCVDDCAVADVTITTDEPVYPIKRDTLMIYPVGTFRAVLTTPELKYALARSHIAHIHEVAIYKADMIFEDYIDHFYRLRLQYKSQGDTVRAELCKKLLVSLYGKFGQTGYVYESDTWIEDLSSGMWRDIDVETGVITRHRRLGGLVQVRKEEGESRESHPAIAAHVTAYGRQLLWRLQLAAGRDNVLYSDTDSLYILGDPTTELMYQVHEHELGKLKLETVDAEITIHGPKDYVCGSKWRTKGARRNSVWTNQFTFSQDKWSGLKGMCNTDTLDRPTTSTVIKHLSRRYSKGTVDYEGHVSPIRI